MFTTVSFVNYMHYFQTSVFHLRKYVKDISLNMVGLKLKIQSDDLS